MDDPTGIVFSLHPVADGSADGPVADSVADWAPTAPGVTDLGELPAGGYWLVGTYATHADESVRISFCLGPNADACMDTGDTGDTGSDTGGEPDSSVTPKTAGCGACATADPNGAALPLGILLSVVAMRRRRVSGR